MTISDEEGRNSGYHLAEGALKLVPRNVMIVIKQLIVLRVYVSIWLFSF